MVTCSRPNNKPRDQHHPNPHLKVWILFPKKVVLVERSNEGVEDIATTEESTAEQSYGANCLNSEDKAGMEKQDK